MWRPSWQVVLVLVQETAGCCLCLSHNATMTHTVGNATSESAWTDHSQRAHSHNKYGEYITLQQNIIIKQATQRQVKHTAYARFSFNVQVHMDNQNSPHQTRKHASTYSNILPSLLIKHMRLIQETETERDKDMSQKEYAWWKEISVNVSL